MEHIVGQYAPSLYQFSILFISYLVERYYKYHKFLSKNITLSIKIKAQQMMLKVK